LRSGYSYTSSIPHPITNLNINEHANANSNTNLDSNTNLNADTNLDTHTNTHPDSLASRGFHSRTTGNGLGTVGRDV
jgi:hypothetical protein